LDIPALRTADDDAGMYLVASSHTPGWPGAVAYQSIDGLSYSVISSLPTGATVGFANNSPTAVSYANDVISEIEVRLMTGSLSSSTWDSAIDDGNIAAWGAPGRWEIVSFSTASQQAGGEWLISGLARGLLDTLQYADNHVAGDKFVILNSAYLRRVVFSVDTISDTRQIKAVTIGRTLDSTGSQDFVIGGGALEPWAPHSLHASLSAGTWSLSWDRQDRIRTRAWWQSAMSESTESYEIDILNEADAVLDTKTASTTSYSYTQSEQETDNGGLPIDLLRFRVAQVSTNTGRGNLSGICTVGYSYEYIDVSSSATTQDASKNSVNAFYAFDDNYSTTWQCTSSSANQWIRCVWSSGKNIRQVGIIFDNVCNMDLEYSDDGTTWNKSITLIPTFGDQGPGGTMEYFQTPDKGSHVQWRLKNNSAQTTVIEIREAELMEIFT